jgi:hypothetical protein
MYYLFKYFDYCGEQFTLQHLVDKLSILEFGFRVWKTVPVITFTCIVDPISKHREEGFDFHATPMLNTDN